MKNFVLYHDVQQDPPAAYCDKCGQEVYHEEARYRWEGRWVCQECFKYAVESALSTYPEQIALEMGLEVERFV